MSAEVFEAIGTAERVAALFMLEQIPGAKPVTLGGDKGYDTADFVAECRHIWVTPHVAQNDQSRGGSAIDAGTTRHEGYAISQRKRRRIEECSLSSSMCIRVGATICVLISSERSGTRSEPLRPIVSFLPGSLRCFDDTHASGGYDDEAFSDNGCCGVDGDSGGRSPVLGAAAKRRQTAS
jgi:hypothetical protein